MVLRKDEESAQSPTDYPQSVKAAIRRPDNNDLHIILDHRDLLGVVAKHFRVQQKVDKPKAQ
jgi:hypothetical protein